MNSLSSEQSFPYDALDTVLTYACEGSAARAVQLALVCRYWHDRFVVGDALWEVIHARQSRLTTAANWGRYDRMRSAAQAARSLAPLKPPTLHPIEDCEFAFRCPMYAEALRVVSDDVFYCDACRENVYLVRTQEELDLHTRSHRHCVMVRKEDVIPFDPIPIAVLGPSQEVLSDVLRRLASDASVRRSAGVFPEAVLSFLPHPKSDFYTSRRSASLSSTTFRFICATFEQLHSRSSPLHDERDMEQSISLCWWVEKPTPKTVPSLKDTSNLEASLLGSCDALQLCSLAGAKIVGTKFDLLIDDLLKRFGERMFKGKRMASPRAALPAS